MDLNIIYEDSYILVVEKPPKIPSQNDKTNDKDMITYIKEYLKMKYPKCTNPYVGLVHRLDRPVGGIMLFAKTKQANANLSEQIKNKTVNKSYLAIACGKALNKEEKLIDYLLKNERLNISKVVTKNTNNSKEAILEYKIIETIDTNEFGTLNLAKINLYTGRHHQIRVQLSNINLPLWGDTKYNINFKNTNEWTQIALWAESISFNHPKTNKNIIFHSKPKEYPFNLFKI